MVVSVLNDLMGMDPDDAFWQAFLILGNQCFFFRYTALMVTVLINRFVFNNYQLLCHANVDKQENLDDTGKMLLYILLVKHLLDDESFFFLWSILWTQSIYLWI